MKTFSVILAICTLTSCNATIEEEPPPTPTNEFQCELGTYTEMQFTPLDAGSEAELHLGFQGFLFFKLRVRAKGDVPSRVKSRANVQIGSDEPTSASMGNTLFSADGAGSFLSGELNVFLTASKVKDYIGETAKLVVRSENDTHFCVIQGEFVLVDDDPCIHTGEQPICPDGQTQP